MFSVATTVIFTVAFADNPSLSFTSSSITYTPATSPLTVGLAVLAPVITAPAGPLLMVHWYTSIPLSSEDLLPSNCALFWGRYIVTSDPALATGALFSAGGVPFATLIMTVSVVHPARSSTTFNSIA